MTLSPLVDAPITAQDSVIEIVRKGDGTHDHDEVFVTTSLTLAADLANDEVTLLLPMSGTAGQKPLLRYTEDPVTQPAATFDDVERSVFDQRVADALQAIDEAERKEQDKLAKAIRDAAKGFSQAVLTVRPGQRNLRFFYTVAAPRADDGQFELAILGPLASFIIQPGGSIGVTALAPRGATVTEAVALANPTDPGSVIPSLIQADLAGRRVLGWTWQNDPLFRIKYHY